MFEEVEQAAALLYAEIILPLALPKTYTYAIPLTLQKQVAPGMRAEVVFGKQKKYAGVIKNLFTEKPKGFEPKEIQNLLDSQPVIHQSQLDLWEWIARYYLCTEGEVMAAALPAHFKLSSETILIYNETYGDDFSALSHDEYLVAEGLLMKRELKLEEVQLILDSSHVYPVVKKLIEKKVCFAWESIKEKFIAKTEIYVRLSEKYADEEHLNELLNNWNSAAPKQMELLLAYLHYQRTEGEVKQSDLLKKSGATAAQLKRLEEKGILVREKITVDRLRQLPMEIDIDFTLSDAQQSALNAVKLSLEEKAVCLLQGVTSSGKTQVYIRLMEEIIRTGKQVLFLLPEIALTAQIIRRLQKHFGGYIAIYHSKFNPNERVEIWNKVKDGTTKIVLGVRSSLFLPFENLGLIIVDEEHDASYKQQEPAPRYHARDAAVYYASRLGAKVLLGSATPSMETYYNATISKYGLVQLNERYGGIEMPVIEIADTRQGTKSPHTKVVIGPLLKERIEQTLELKDQVILFQNRRGYSPFMMCTVCGFIPHCDHCDVTLTYHKLHHRLQCHYCGNSYPRPQTCIRCGSSSWLEKNFGTERIEEDLKEEFPEARIARMDLDTIRGKNAHDALIKEFEERQLDILVGTQMVVKGLDFDHVQVVGILDADGLLSFADFRVNERAFQLMEQVSGRAGRRDRQGTVVIQSRNAAHPVLEFVRQHNYQQFYDHEIIVRKNFGYPPFTRIIQLTFRHKVKEKCAAAAELVASQLAKHLGNYLIGPAEPVVNRIRENYLMELMFKLPKDTRTNELVRELIKQQMVILQNDKNFRSVDIIPDVDPV
ncbi:replication restart helicase PriA [Pollutibacter soli]|uniref:replication restart helicase PriA n=1 Tax=Pollutibacter soli TaxID=3034157 RepID=UPI003013CA26